MPSRFVSLMLVLLTLTSLGACVPVSNDMLGDDDSPNDSPTPFLEPTPTPPVDADGDGVPLADDCDDTDPSIYPGAEDVCDGMDNDCDDLVDEDSTATTFFLDSDGDGYGDPDVSVVACAAPEGYVADHSDCDDSHVTVNPDAIEVCDELDNDCDGIVDDDSSVTYYQDFDNDGYGTEQVPVYGCDIPEGYVAQVGDCDDADPAVYPGAPEVCNDVDDDCDGSVDEDAEQTYLIDGDLDGYGNPEETVTGPCDPDPGMAEDGGAATYDCDDANEAVHPGALEACSNGVDDNCNGVTDEGTAQDYYRDEDGDGFGAPDSPTVTACSGGVGYSPNASDCDDADFSVHPMFVDADFGSDQGDGTSEHPFVAVQDAIDASNCGQVWIGAGSYAESLQIIGKTDLAIRAMEGAHVSIVSPDGARCLYMNDSSQILIDGVEFVGTSTGVSLSGVGLAIVGCTDVTVQNLAIRYMKSSGTSNAGGGAAVINSTAVTFNKVSFENNAAHDGGALAVGGSEVLIEGCEFDNNVANGEGSALDVVGGDGGALLLSDAVIVDRLMTEGYGTVVDVQESIFQNNMAQNTGGAARAESGTELNLDSCQFDNNRAAIRGGAVANPALVRRCVFVDNLVPPQGIASYYGGAMVLESESTVTNNLFWHNEAYYGGAIDINNFDGDNGAQALVNNTFVDNRATFGATLYVFLANSVLFGNNIVAHYDAIDWAAIQSIVAGFDYEVAYNDFYLPEDDNDAVFGGPNFDSDVLDEQGNMTVDPYFVQYPPDENGDPDFHLTAESPCIGTGNSAYIDPGGAAPDMGAYGGPQPLPY